MDGDLSILLQLQQLCNICCVSSFRTISLMKALFYAETCSVHVPNVNVRARE
jgi:hypothetical protein